MKNFFRIRIVILDGDLDLNIIFLAIYQNGIVQWRMMTIQIFDKRQNTPIILKFFFVINSIIRNGDFQPLVKKSQFTDLSGEGVIIILDGVENSRIRFEMNFGSSFSVSPITFNSLVFIPRE